MAQSTATADHRDMLSLHRPGALLRQLGLDTVYLLLALPMGILTFTVVVTGWSLALGLAITLIGLPIAMITIHTSRWMAWVERRRAALVLGETIPGVYRSSDGRFLERLKALFSDPSTWKDLGWHLLLLPVGIADFVIAVTAWSASLRADPHAGLLVGAAGFRPHRARPLQGRLVGPRLPGHGHRHRPAARRRRAGARHGGRQRRALAGRARPEPPPARGARRGPGPDARRRRRRRRRRAAPHRARPARRRAGAARRPRPRPGHGRGALRPRPRGRARARGQGARRGQARDGRAARPRPRHPAGAAVRARPGRGDRRAGRAHARCPPGSRSTSTGACPRRSSWPPTSPSPRR